MRLVEFEEILEHYENPVIIICSLHKPDRPFSISCRDSDYDILDAGKITELIPSLGSEKMKNVINKSVACVYVFDDAINFLKICQKEGGIL